MNHKKSWDLGRFVQTLTFFEVFPLLRCLQDLLRGSRTEAVVHQEKKAMGIILVIGATAEVGKQVISRLQASDYSVKALVGSVSQLGSLIGENLEVIEGRITNLKPELFQDVTTVIYCPENLGNSLEGFDALVQLATQELGEAEKKVIFDFSQPSAEIQSFWGAIDDVVMGGVSASGLRWGEGNAMFSGQVSTANNGGFASVRTRNFEPPLDLSAYAGIELHVKGDGNRYKFIARCEGKWDGVGYSYSFDTISDRWISVQIPFTELIPVFRAKTVPEMGSFDASCIYSLQLMLSKFEYDKALNPNFEAGNFALQVQSLQAYGAAPTPQFILVSPPGISYSATDSLRHSGLTYTIIRPNGLTQEVAELCVKAINSADFCNQTIEV